MCNRLRLCFGERCLHSVALAEARSIDSICSGKVLSPSITIFSAAIEMRFAMDCEWLRQNLADVEWRAGVHSNDYCYYYLYKQLIPMKSFKFFVCCAINISNAALSSAFIHSRCCRCYCLRWWWYMCLWLCIGVVHINIHSFDLISLQLKLKCKFKHWIITRHKWMVIIKCNSERVVIQFEMNGCSCCYCCSARCVVVNLSAFLHFKWNTDCIEHNSKYPI